MRIVFYNQIGDKIKEKEVKDEAYLDNEMIQFVWRNAQLFSKGDRIEIED